MSICKSCGAPVLWVKMKSGKAMPVNAEPVKYAEDPNGKENIITKDGQVARGSFYGPSDSLKTGYISHFSTCPNASEHRRRT